jgi:hypothetical protein
METLRRFHFLYENEARREKSSFEKDIPQQMRGYIKSGRTVLKLPTAARCSSVLEEIKIMETLRRFHFFIRERGTTRKSSFEKNIPKQMRGILREVGRR